VVKIGSACNGILNLLDRGYLRLMEAVVKRITVIKFGLNDGNDKLYKMLCNLGQGG